VPIEDRVSQRRPDHRMVGGVLRRCLEVRARDPVDALGQRSGQVAVPMNGRAQVRRRARPIDGLQAQDMRNDTVIVRDRSGYASRDLLLGVDGRGLAQIAVEAFGPDDRSCLRVVQMERQSELVSTWPGTAAKYKARLRPQPGRSGI